MSLVRLELRHVRNIAEATLTPSPSCNVIFGANASGKTSLLEAIHILGLARSFRTPHIKQVIQRGSEGLTVFGRRSRADGSEVALGIERTLRETRIRVAGTNVDRAAELARWLPVQVINPESHEVLEQGPRFRRQFLTGVCSTWNMASSRRGGDTIGRCGSEMRRYAKAGRMAPSPCGMTR